MTGTVLALPTIPDSLRPDLPRSRGNRDAHGCDYRCDEGERPEVNRVGTHWRLPRVFLLDEQVRGGSDRRRGVGLPARRPSSTPRSPCSGGAPRRGRWLRACHRGVPRNERASAGRSCGERRDRIRHVVRQRLADLHDQHRRDGPHEAHRSRHGPDTADLVARWSQDRLRCSGGGRPHADRSHERRRLQSSNPNRGSWLELPAGLVTRRNQDRLRQQPGWQ